MRGRTPCGPEAVEQLPGTDKAKERVRVILQTMTGELRVCEACAQLGISEQRLRQLRAALLQAAVASVEDQPSGRPRKAEEPKEVARLRQQVEQLQQELEIARIREEVALVLPHVSVPPPAPVEGVQAAAAPQKKRRSKR